MCGNNNIISCRVCTSVCKSYYIKLYTCIFYTVIINRYNGFLYQYANTSLWYVAGHKIGIVNNIVGSRYQYHLILLIPT